MSQGGCSAVTSCHSRFLQYSLTLFISILFDLLCRQNLVSHKIVPTIEIDISLVYLLEDVWVNIYATRLLLV